MLLQLTALFTAIVSVLAAPKAPSSPLPVTSYQLPVTAPQLTAPNSFLVDTTSGVILHSQNTDRAVSIASITKLMTAVVLFEQMESNPTQPPLKVRGGEEGLWQQRVTFEARDKRNGDIPYLIVGDEVSVRQAWNIMLVASSNDATMMLVRTMHNKSLALSGVTKLSFVELMNKKAAALGLRSTRFTDPTGLDTGNVSTAREVAVLARYALSFSEIRSALLQRKFVFAPTGQEVREVFATNQLLTWFRLPGVKLFGGKTGHIKESGYNLVFAAGRGKQELIGVVLGSADNNARFEDMSRLLSWGFSAVPAAQSLGD